MSARRAPDSNSPANVDRRQFLAVGGSGLLASTIPSSYAWGSSSDTVPPVNPSWFPPRQTSLGTKKKIPIGVFDPVYADLSSVKL